MEGAERAEREERTVLSLWEHHPDHPACVPVPVEHGMRTDGNHHWQHDWSEDHHKLVAESHSNYLAGHTSYRNYRRQLALAISGCNLLAEVEPEPEPEAEQQQKPEHGAGETKPKPSLHLWSQRHRAAITRAEQAAGCAAMLVPPADALMYLCTALFDYHPPRMEEHENDLWFHKGDVIEVLQDKIEEMGEGWSLGRLTDSSIHSAEVGFFPANYTRQVVQSSHSQSSHHRRSELTMEMPEEVLGELTLLRTEEAAKAAVLDIPIPIRRAVITELSTNALVQASLDGRATISVPSEGGWQGMSWAQRLTAFAAPIARAAYISLRSLRL